METLTKKNSEISTTVNGTIERMNAKGTGILINERWYNKSNYVHYKIPFESIQLGDEISLEVNSKGFINSFTIRGLADSKEVPKEVPFEAEGVLTEHCDVMPTPLKQTAKPLDRDASILRQVVVYATTRSNVLAALIEKTTSITEATCLVREFSHSVEDFLLGGKDSFSECLLPLDAPRDIETATEVSFKPVVMKRAKNGTRKS